MQEKDTSLQTSPQLAFAEQSGVAVALSQKQTISLYKKSKQSGISFDVLEEVYRRGFNEALVKDEPADAYAFNRVNSFIAGGAAAEMDRDLYEEKKGLWANIHAKRERIKRGSGERMRKPGEKGAPSKEALVSARESYEIDEDSESGLAAKAKKSGISIATLRKVYRRGVAAWNSGHRPGTTPQQWGMARVNSYITKGKGTYGGADKDLHEVLDEGREAYHAGLSASTAKAREAHWKKMDKLSDRDPRAYEPAPGDATAKTKESKHTKKYHKMYGEEVEIEEKYGKGYKSPADKIAAAAKRMGRPDPLEAMAKTAEKMKKDLEAPGMVGHLSGVKKEEVEIKEGKHDDLKLIRPGMWKHTSGSTIHYGDDRKTYTVMHGGTKRDPKRYRTLDSAKAAIKESYTGAEKVSSDSGDPSSRFIGTDSIVNVYKSDTPGYPEHKRSKAFEVVKKVVREQLEEEYGPCEGCTCGFAEEYIAERGADSKGYFRSTESGAGLTAKGAAHFRRQNPGSKLSTAVTEKNPKGKRAARRRSFCARMSGMKGPMKDEKGRPTRKAMSLRRWRCR